MNVEKVAKRKKKDVKIYSAVRLKKATGRLLGELAIKANERGVCQTIFGEDLIHWSLSLLTNKDIEKLQISFLSNSHKLALLLQRYVELNGPTTEEEFNGFMMTDEFQEFRKSHEYLWKPDLSLVESHSP
jgi:hypothetical protein